ncbi:MAG TPA: DUF1059 domain-containing protein [Acidimicrobiales bacterium]|nr:DUF1059 domain-containing protein [Acidimicrobiales bacterium]
MEAEHHQPSHGGDEEEQMQSIERPGAAESDGEDDHNQQEPERHDGNVDACTDERLVQDVTKEHHRQRWDREPALEIGEGCVAPEFRVVGEEPSQVVGGTTGHVRPQASEPADLQGEQAATRGHAAPEQQRQRPELGVDALHHEQPKQQAGEAERPVSGTLSVRGNLLWETPWESTASIRREEQSGLPPGAGPTGGHTLRRLDGEAYSGEKEGVAAALVGLPRPRCGPRPTELHRVHKRFGPPPEWANGLLVKEFSCGDAVPGCTATFTASSESEILWHVAAHAREDHGLANCQLQLLTRGTHLLERLRRA